MSDCFVGEIRMFGGNYAPVNWALCDGRSLRIVDYETLYALIGTTYGGDGATYFNLPELRGRVPIHMGQGTGLTNRVLADKLGTETVALAATNLPAHTHLISAGGNGTTAAPAGNYPANSVGFSLYSSAAPDSLLSTAAVQAFGGSGLPHSNLMPTQCVNFIIALNGIFPQRP